MSLDVSTGPRRIPFWGSVFTITGILVLCMLGYWQVQRHGWKQELIAKVDAQYEFDASDIPITLDDMRNYSGLKRGYLTGQYSHTKAVLLQPRTHDGIAGYEVLTPFRLDNEERLSVLVNRGWIPHERERPELFLMDLPMEPLKITGMIRRAPRINAFTPENNALKDVWYRVDLNEISKHREVSLVSGVVFYVEMEERRIRDYPLPVSHRSSLRNNHAQYAAFWFSMAFFMVVIYWFRFIRKV